MGVDLSASEEMARANSNPNCTKRKPRQSGAFVFGEIPKVMVLIGVERLNFPILLPLVSAGSVTTLTSVFVPAHAITFVRVLTVALPPTLMTVFSRALPIAFVPAHPRTFALVHTEPMAGNAHEKPLIWGENPPDGNLVFELTRLNPLLQ